MPVTVLQNPPEQKRQKRIQTLPFEAIPAEERIDSMLLDIAKNTYHVEDFSKMGLYDQLAVLRAMRFSISERIRELHPQE